MVVPSSIEDLHSHIVAAKVEAIEDAKKCSMSLSNYDDSTLMMEDVSTIELLENEDDNANVSELTNSTPSIDCNVDDNTALQEDLLQIRLRKDNCQGMPMYSVTKEKGTKTDKSYKSSQFVKYQGAYIRKSTALYLLQENPVLSSDRLIRVRGSEDKTVETEAAQTQTIVSSGDLCIFRRIDDINKLLIGRVVQFSYLKGTKRQQEYSGIYVDLSKDFKSIGAFANWFAMSDITYDNKVEFRPLVDVFTQGLHIDGKLCQYNTRQKCYNYYDRLFIAIKHDHHQCRKLEGHLKQAF